MARTDLTRRNERRERIIPQEDFYETMPMTSQPVVRERYTRESANEARRINGGLLLAQSLASYILGVVEALLGIRLVLALFDLAGTLTTTNTFARFIFQITNPLIAPFASLFNASTSDPGIWTIAFAMLIYGITGYAVVRLFRLGQPREI